jgi:hypothetical protein
MGKALAVATVVFMALGVPALAYADKGNDQGDQGDQGDKGGDHGDHGGGGGDHHSAPEPLTIIGLALGAGGIAVARWATNRKSRNR